MPYQQWCVETKSQRRIYLFTRPPAAWGIDNNSDDLATGTTNKVIRGWKPSGSLFVP